MCNVCRLIILSLFLARKAKKANLYYLYMVSVSLRIGDRSPALGRGSIQNQTSQTPASYRMLSEDSAFQEGSVVPSSDS